MQGLEFIKFIPRQNNVLNSLALKRNESHGREGKSLLQNGSLSFTKWNEMKREPVFWKINSKSVICEIKVWEICKFRKQAYCTLAEDICMRYPVRWDNNISGWVGFVIFCDVWTQLTEENKVKWGSPIGSFNPATPTKIFPQFWKWINFLIFLLWTPLCRGK